MLVFPRFFARHLGPAPGAQAFLAVWVLVGPSGCKDDQGTEHGRRNSPPAGIEPGGPGGPAANAPLDDDTLATRYVAAKAVLEDPRVRSDPAAVGELARAEDDLELVANKARDSHLRANASLLLGELEQSRGNRPKAVAYFRHASKLVPDDAGPHLALALALAGAGNHAEAAEAQKTAVKLDADNLEAWLALGEMLVRAGKQGEAAEAYAGYELRRKGLLDGLTLKKDGNFVVGPEERAECALALAAAADNGTALALLYALESEPEVTVRAAIVRTMGIQRLRGYEEPLTRQLARESEAETKSAIEWALAEIRRDPVDSKPTPVPD